MVNSVANTIVAFDHSYGSEGHFGPLQRKALEYGIDHLIPKNGKADDDIMIKDLLGNSDIASSIKASWFVHLDDHGTNELISVLTDSDVRIIRFSTSGFLNPVVPPANDQKCRVYCCLPKISAIEDWQWNELISWTKSAEEKPLPSVFSHGFKVLLRTIALYCEAYRVTLAAKRGKQLDHIPQQTMTRLASSQAWRWFEDQEVSKKLEEMLTLVKSFGVPDDFRKVLTDLENCLNDSAKDHSGQVNTDWSVYSDHLLEQLRNYVDGGSAS